MSTTNESEQKLSFEEIISKNSIKKMFLEKMISFLIIGKKLSFEETISKTSLKKYKLPFEKMISFYYFF